MKITIDSFLTKNIYNNMQILNNTISNEITYLIMQVLTSYKYIPEKKEDLYRGYIHNYIQYNIAKDIYKISYLIIEKIDPNRDKLSSVYLSKLKNHWEIIMNLYDTAFDNKDLLMLNDKISQRIYKEWDEADQHKICQDLFKDKEDYLYKNISLYDFLDSINISKLKNIRSASSLIVFISEIQKEAKKEDVEENFYKQLFSFEKNLTESLFSYSKNKAGKVIKSVIENHVKNQKEIDDYIIEVIITPVVAEIINKFDTAKKININEVNEYINLKYRNSPVTYNDILLPSTLLNKNDENVKILEVVLEKLYLDSIYKQGKNSILSNDITLKSFTLFPKEIKDLYLEARNYNTLLLRLNNTWTNDEKSINSIKKVFEEKIKYEDSVIKEMKKEINASKPSMLYTTFQKAYDNRKEILSGIAVASVLVCVYQQGGKLSRMLSNVEDTTKNIKDASKDAKTATARLETATDVVGGAKRILASIHNLSSKATGWFW